MALSLNKPKLDNLAGDVWKSAERLCGKFKAYEYQGVILLIIVIRRVECMLLAWRESKSAEVRAKRPKHAHLHPAPAQEPGPNAQEVAVCAAKNGSGDVNLFRRATLW